MKFSGKMCLMIILKVTKNPLFRRSIFRKATGAQINSLDLCCCKWGLQLNIKNTKIIIPKDKHEKV